MEDGGITGLFGDDVASILIRLTVDQHGGENAGGTDGNLWAGDIYILGTGTGRPFSKEWEKPQNTGAATPEPASILICGLGLAGLAAASRRKK
jgi:hypothetical protein